MDMLYVLSLSVMKNITIIHLFYNTFYIIIFWIFSSILFFQQNCNDHSDTNRDGYECVYKNSHFTCKEQSLTC